MIAMWLDRAEGGDASAQYQLGYCYETGQGVPRDLGTACRWYLRAARQGHARAQYYYGLACSNGAPGVEWDRIEACKWLTLAAKAGLREAIRDLGAFKLSSEEQRQGTQAAREFVAVPEPQLWQARVTAAPPIAPPAQSTQLGFPF